MRHKVLVAAISAVLSLSGCGGGGDSENPSLKINLSSSSIDIQENYVKTVSLTTTSDSSDDSEISYVVLSSSDSISGVVSNGTLFVSASSVDMAVSGSLTIVATSNDISGKSTLKVNVKNTSADDIIAGYNSSLYKNGFIYNDVMEIGSYYSEAMYLGGDISFLEKASLNVEFLEPIVKRKSSIASLASSVDASVSRYKKGGISDAELIGAYDLLMADIDNGGSESIELINSLANKSTMGLPSFNPDIQVTVFNGQLSYFYKNTDYGYLDNDDWVFSSDFDFLNDLLTSFSYNKTCEIDQ
jgi:hypothetical protein